MTGDVTNPTETPIVLIHGLWMTPLSWEGWADRFSQRGHKVLAPSWPGMDVGEEQLRRDPSPIARQNIPDILNHYEGIIRGLERPPIIMGHSFGGAFVQVLLDRGLGAAGVGVDAGTVRGVLDLPLSTLRSAFTLLRNPLFRNRAVPLNAEQFHYAFINTMTLEQSEPVFRRYCVPGSRNVLLTGANANINPGTPLKVDFSRNDRAPLLFIGGGQDHVVPAKVNQHNAAKYSKSQAVTEFNEFPERSHYTVGQDGWEEVADYALDWATSHMRNAPAASHHSSS